MILSRFFLSHFFRRRRVGERASGERWTASIYFFIRC
jgi:hypothetical protein